LEISSIQVSEHFQEKWMAVLIKEMRQNQSHAAHTKIDAKMKAAFGEKSAGYAK
jgi:hypothetical protein